ncbi:MAG: 2-amino-4-hydroxy-6-hydroxymethyldihydropteridine diphosphokinase [Bacteroidales bacterium]|nr:2-amino-4-hydroxy-6-hydroxymethyldihydropteridine diphosphokinase [Bacteroidales bacterium]
MKYYLNIGSNLGDRNQNLLSAIQTLESKLQATAQASSIIESTAWGFDSDNTFLNIGIAIDSDIIPEEMLRITQSIERNLGSSTHRNPDGSYCDRLIDIDLIAVDEETIESENLTIPHPRMHLREFVLAPMAQLAPHWNHPILHKTASQLLDK